MHSELALEHQIIMCAQGPADCIPGIHDRRDRAKEIRRISGGARLERRTVTQRDSRVQAYTSTLGTAGGVRDSVWIVTQTSAGERHMVK